MTRASASYRLALEIVSIQLAERGLCLTCPLCNEPIRAWDLVAPYRTEREHMIAMAADPKRYDKPWNQRIAHVACAKAKTHGTRANGGLGGDISETARAARHEKHRLHGKPQSRHPIQSRGFQKPPDGMKRKIPTRPLRAREER